MRSSRILVVLLALALPTAAVLARAAAGTEAAGRITAIAPKSNQLTVLTPRGDHLKLRVDDRTKVELDGRTVSLKSFVVGDPVKVRYESGSDRQHALAITSDATTARDVRDKMRGALKTAGKYAYREKEKFKRGMNCGLEDLDAQIAGLEARAKNSSEEARKRLTPEIDALKERASTVRKKLSEAGSAAEDRWQGVKKGTALEMDKLSSSIDRAAGWLRKQ